MSEKSTTTITARASAALPASGADDSSPTKVDLGAGTQSVTLWATYTRGGSGGQARLKPELSADGVAWYKATLIDGTIGGSAPYGVLGTRAVQYDLPAPADGSALRTAHALDVRGARFLRIPAAEVGNTGAPGTLALALSEDA